ncbi:MAG: 16S rRNA (guanine(527)-N(7))-methyltransferase RsmG [Alphaproteobacteria bacterium]|nr:16S rRNA (guanine(527)-N(7))-methyltransferase RsmG [Alphaproteobacteria bacterium]
MPEETLDKIFQRHGFHVSRETLEALGLYQTLLLKWQKAINLVGPATLDAVAERHFFDSAQLLRFMPDVNVRLVDMGSGAGFPGLVLSLLGVAEVHLIESDVRKATFLREVSRETKAAAQVHDTRVEDIQLPKIDVFTARALAPLKDLLSYMHRLSTPEHAAYGLFMKGMQYQDELEKAAKQWSFDVELYPSMTDLASKVIKINNLSKK